MRGALRLAPLLLMPLATVADGQQFQTTPAAAVDPANDPETLVALTDLDQRLTVPVELGAAGPYPFVIDTGAERTVVSRELASLLGLAQGRSVNLSSMTGRSRVDTVIVPELTIPSIGEPHRIEAPALAARHLGAAGLLGIDAFGGHQVSIDLATGTMAVRPAPGRKEARRTASDEILVTAKNYYGQLIVTDAALGRARIRVVIDTGSEVSIGNSQLRKLAGLSRRSTRKVEVTSVTGDSIMADYAHLPSVTVGTIHFGALPIAFADVEPFAFFGLSDTPALLLGMDALRSFRRVDIDFANRQVRFLMPKASRHDLERTGSRIPGARGTATKSIY